MLDNILTAFLYFLGMGIAFIPLERSFLCTQSDIFRKEWFTDVLFYFGQSLIWNFVTLLVLNYIFGFLPNTKLRGLREIFQSTHIVFQFFILIFLGDLFIYWAHRLQHRINFLWKFHRVHHTAETVDYIAAFREHPLDNIYTRGIESLPAFLLGFKLEQITAFVAFRGVWALFIHSNVNLRFGVLEALFGSPHLHHWHHDLKKGGDCNYANLFPLMDILFETYYNPKEASEQFGIEEDYKRGYISLLLEPLLPTFLRSKVWK